MPSYVARKFSKERKFFIARKICRFMLRHAWICPCRSCATRAARQNAAGWSAIGAAVPPRRISAVNGARPAPQENFKVVAFIIFDMY